MPCLPDIEVDKVAVEAIAVVVQQVVPLDAKDHHSRLEAVKQLLHPFDASLFASSSLMEMTVVDSSQLS